MTDKPKIIELTHGEVTLVSPEDYERVSAYSWCLSKRGRFRQHKRVMGHVYRNGKRTTQMLHRLIMECPDHLVVDHIDHNGLNNTRDNLRICTQGQNSANRRPESRGSSKFKGVHKHKSSGKWRAQISDSGRNRHLGLFGSERDAALAHNEAAIKMHGEFAFLNELGEHNV
jgi:hypothetical protein